MDVVVDALSKDNPLDQDLILKLILANVGKADLDDLLDCRLVNHRWNRVAIQVLEEQHGYAIELDYKKLLKFKSLLWKTQVSRSAESELAGRKELVSLRLSLKIEVDEREPEKANEIGEVSQLLLFHPHLKVAFFSCLYESCFTGSEGEDVLTNHELFIVLRLISPTLKHIKLRVQDFSDEPETSIFEKFDFEEKYLALEFPRLTSLHYKLSYYEDHDEEMLDTTMHVLSIIKRAPNLKKLHLNIWEGGGEESINSLEKLIQPIAPNLEELKVCFDEDIVEVEMVLKVLCEMEFPKLAYLKLSSLEISENTKQLFQNLKTNCPSLARFEIKSLYLYLIDEPAELVERERQEQELVFPQLPNIRHFGFYVRFSASADRQQMAYSSLKKTMVIFPSVNVMSLDIGLILILDAHLRESGQLVPQPGHLTFPNILTLEIQIYSLNTLNGGIEVILDVTRRSYCHMFPNIKNLVIKSPNVYPAWNSDEKEKLVRVMEFLCCHPEIQQIEIQNCGLPLFQQISESNPGPGLQGVKSLKMLPPKIVASTGCSQFNLHILLARFPALEFLQFGKAVLYKPQIQTVRSAFKSFQDPISKYKKLASSSSSTSTTSTA